jgi:hypothetical protein
MFDRMGTALPAVNVCVSAGPIKQPKLNGTSGELRDDAKNDWRANMNDLTCIHSKMGLCESCQADYDADPAAWVEYGDHPAGIAAWQALQEEMDREMGRARAEPVPPPDPTVPF